MTVYRSMGEIEKEVERRRGKKKQERKKRRERKRGKRKIKKKKRNELSIFLEIIICKLCGPYHFS
jgi:hypothetical protein